MTDHELLERKELYRENLNAFADELRVGGFIPAVGYKDLLWNAYSDGLISAAAFQALDFADACIAHGEIVSNGEEINIKMTYADVVRCTGILS